MDHTGATRSRAVLCWYLLGHSAPKLQSSKVSGHLIQHQLDAQVDEDALLVTTQDLIACLLLPDPGTQTARA